jgi:ferredoxin
MAISKVWIEEGCTLCGTCEDLCPDVFEMGDETAFVKEDAEFGPNEECIKNSAEECPVEVILYEEE